MKKRQFVSILLVLCMVLGFLPVNAFAASGDEEPVIVIAGSDFQNTNNDHDAGAAQVTSILEQIQEAGYTTADGFLFAGDYDYGYDDSDIGKATLQAAVQDAYGTNMHEVYIEGNHDNPDNSSNDDLVANGTLSPSGANDADAYGVYVIHESDYMWYNDDEDTIKNTAAALSDYLDAKVAENYDKPIFVVSHLPLHYNMRTYNDGDGMYANYIFDELNAAGADGLNIIFLFGHNHSNGWDDYLGGSAIYLEKGDSINIAQASKTAFDVETLNFTYMNAGYVAYYRNVNTGSECDLTMTVFEITDGNVTVKRYSENGVHELKSIGVRNSHKNETAYDPNTTVYTSPQTITWAANATVTDPTTGVSVTAPGLTGVTVTAEKKSVEGYTAYVSYDITPLGYTQGHTATVTVPVDTSVFDGSRPVVVIDQTLGTTVSKTIVNGAVTFTTDHFSVYDVAQLDATYEGGWIEIPGNGYVYELDTDGIDTGVEYLIVANSHTKALSAAASSSNAVDIEIDGNYAYIDSDAYGWTFTYSSGAYYIRLGSTYLNLSRGSLGSSSNTGSSQRWTVSGNGDGSYDITRTTSSWGGSTTYNLRWSNSNGVFQASSSDKGPVRLYKYKGTSESSYAQLSGVTSHEIAINSYANQAAVEAMLRTCITVKAGATDNTGTGAAVTKDYSFSGTVDPTTAGDYPLYVTYGGVTLGTVTVKVVAKTATDVTVEPMNGEVQRGASASTVTGSTMTVTYDDGSRETIPVTVGMLSGDLNVKVNGTYTGLTVTYAGQTVRGYTLAVVNVKGNDFPTYPNGGSVDVNKSATGLDFQNTGLARVELSTSGLPVEKGADVIIMLDTSSSMSSNSVVVDGVEVTRLQVMKDSLKNLLSQLQSNGADGKPMDIRVAIAEFNGYFMDSSSPYYISSSDHLINGSIRTSEETSDVFTGTDDLTAGAFVDVHSLTDTTFIDDVIVAGSGTNYDYAFDAVYQLGEAVTAANETAGEQRDLFVIFMSDGAPFQYNYFSAQSGSSNGTTDAQYWNNWLQGTIEDSMLDSNARNDYYNKDGKHWMAEAIKGDASKTYPVIRKNNAADTDSDNWVEVAGLGATMYSIGFCLERDKEITVDSMDYVIKNIASSDEYYFRADSAADLTNAFTAIGHEIRYAAQNAVFEDQMGSAFDLQMDPTVTDSSDNTRTVDTDITITTHPIYTSAQVGTEVNGYTVTADDVGKTYGEGTVVEKVSFTVGEEGNIAAASTAVTETDGNILNDGVICAKNFFYNTTASAKTITLADGSTYSLPAETFYWNIGTINEKQFTLSYTVYLTGSMEGETVPDDSYDTNNYAKLSYTNWLGNEVSQSVPSPSMPWGGANVSYAFYLVDSNGKPLLADGTSADNFLQAYKVTQPVLYKTINLNSDETVLSAVAKEVLPTGYTLYDEKAVYTVQVNSGDGGGSWTIGYDTSKTQSTYVVGYGSSNDYSKDTSVEDGSYDYTHTTVYFAVVWTVGTVPDAVVIDYGLPVDISVLVNDMFGGNATLAGVGKLENKPKATYTTTLDSDFGSRVATTYGAAKVNGDKVRYTLNTSNGMQVAAAETFAYAANYTGATNPGYYYGEVTVIPATTVYYEENFITFKDSSAATDTHGEWSDAGTRDTNATQDEDRPGEYSLGSIDANNVYGYDSAYTSCTTFSNGGAKKVTVNAATGTKAAAPTATFTFTGTGFDVISLTDNQSGAIMVTATNAAGTVYKKTVDDYYGYSYGEYTNEAGETVTGWYVDTQSTDTIWQVPVIKMEGMPYGTYDVEIKVTFLNLADHDDDGSYSFWMDAIRIYDPAKNDTTSNQAYDEDKEYAPDYMTLRDLLVGAGDLDTDDEEATGVVFIDGKNATSDIRDYANPGPNNETYLAQGQGVSFKLTSATKPVSAQIGVKLAYGDKATLKLGESDFQTVETASDMYYEMALTWKQNESGTYESNVIVLSNATANAVISLTNIKLTYDVPASDAQTTAVVDEEVLTAAPMMMRMLYAPVVEEKPDPFVAEYVDATWVGTRAKRTSILSITTSEDVEAVTVNGEEIGTYVTVPKISFENWKLTVAYYRLWIYTDKQATAGIYTYDVIVYNADGLASESIAAELTVR